MEEQPGWKALKNLLLHLAGLCLIFSILFIWIHRANNLRANQLHEFFYQNIVGMYVQEHYIKFPKTFSNYSFK